MRRQVSGLAAGRLSTDESQPHTNYTVLWIGTLIPSRLLLDKTITVQCQDRPDLGSFSNLELQEEMQGASLSTKPIMYSRALADTQVILPQKIDAINFQSALFCLQSYNALALVLSSRADCH